jgi:enoyl-CoA hydratase/carnithine racemase
MKEFSEIIRDASIDNTVRVLVLKAAAGKVFSAGGDFELLKEFDNVNKARECIYNWGGAIELMNSMPKPIICAVDGAAAGGGANLALSCDFVFASEKAKFIQAFINIGLIPDTGGLWALAKFAGVTRAKELAMTGRMIDAEEAKKYGLVLEVVASEKLEETVMSFAAGLAKKAPIAIGLIKQMANQLNEQTLAVYRKTEAECLAITSQTQDHKEGLAAFMEKRAPVFKGE